MKKADIQLEQFTSTFENAVLAFGSTIQAMTILNDMHT